ncbi:hypothetical protein A0O32_1740 [Anoxybacillus flavithermus]|nr:hypothetical protein A0O32_1740 [Anoxybacillus flavithermus]
MERSVAAFCLADASSHTPLATCTRLPNEFVGHYKNIPGIRKFAVWLLLLL